MRTPTRFFHMRIDVRERAVRVCCVPVRLGVLPLRYALKRIPSIPPSATALVKTNRVQRAAAS
jgi:hypothetical protein